MPTRIIERGTAGPAYSAATCPVITKIPAPMTAPMPSVTRLRGPSARVRACSPVASASAPSVAIGLVAERLIPQSWSCPPRCLPRRFDPVYVSRPHEKAAPVLRDEQALGVATRGRLLGDRRGRVQLLQPGLELSGAHAVLPEVPAVVTRVHAGQDAPIHHDVPEVHRGEVVQEIGGDLARLAGHHLEQCLERNGDGEMGEPHEQARGDVKGEVVPPTHRVNRHPLLQTSDEEGEQPPHVTVREGHADRLSPRVGRLAEPPPGEEPLRGERKAQHGPKGQPPRPLRGLAADRCVLTQHVTTSETTHHNSPARPQRADFWPSTPVCSVLWRRPYRK